MFVTAVLGQHFMAPKHKLLRTKLHYFFIFTLRFKHLMCFFINTLVTHYIFNVMFRYFTEYCTIMPLKLPFLISHCTTLNSLVRSSGETNSTEDTLTDNVIYFRAKMYCYSRTCIKITIMKTNVNV